MELEGSACARSRRAAMRKVMTMQNFMVKYVHSREIGLTRLNRSPSVIAV